ncbi:MAG: competence type IV pilus major pilin ComGC [Solibacillus sp.]
MKNERGFTLIEMLVVLLIISVLILVTIPNVTKHSKMIDDKGCEAYLQMLRGQMETYKIEKNKYPTILELETEYFGGEEIKCPNGKKVYLENGELKENKNETVN